MKRANLFRGMAMAFVAMACVQQAKAEESAFGYTYTTDLLPKGQKEVIQWVTWRHEKAHGRFDLFEGKTGFEYGILDNFQGAIYGSYAASRAFHNAADGTTAQPETFANYNVGPDDNFYERSFTGIAFEGIYRIMSPYKDPFGFAVVFEPTIGRDLREIEGRLVFQKNFLDDRLVTAFNITALQEGRWIPTDGPDQEHWDRETDLNFSMGASYRFAPNWSAGLEFMNEREWSCLCFRHENRINNAYYTGPVIQYGTEHFFISMTALMQLPWADDYTSDGNVVGGRNYADDFEKYRLRVKMGYYF